MAVEKLVAVGLKLNHNGLYYLELIFFLSKPLDSSISLCSIQLVSKNAKLTLTYTAKTQILGLNYYGSSRAYV